MKSNKGHFCHLLASTNWLTEVPIFLIQSQKVRILKNLRQKVRVKKINIINFEVLNSQQPLLLCPLCPFVVVGHEQVQVGELWTGNRIIVQICYHRQASLSLSQKALENNGNLNSDLTTIFRTKSFHESTAFDQIFHGSTDFDQLDPVLQVERVIIFSGPLCIVGPKQSSPSGWYNLMLITLHSNYWFRLVNSQLLL